MKKKSITPFNLNELPVDSRFVGFFRFFRKIFQRKPWVWSSDYFLAVCCDSAKTRMGALDYYYLFYLFFFIIFFCFAFQWHFLLSAYSGPFSPRQIYNFKFIGRVKWVIVFSRVYRPFNELTVPPILMSLFSKCPINSPYNIMAQNLAILRPKQGKSVRLISKLKISFLKENFFRKA